MIDSEARVYTAGVIVSVTQLDSDSSQFAYTMRSGDRVWPFDPDFGSHQCVALGQIVFRIGALVDDIRSIFPDDGMPDDNVNLHKILKHVERVHTAIIHYNAMRDELLWYIALRRDLLD